MDEDTETVEGVVSVDGSSALSGKVAIITGASAGIGASLARAFAAAGAGLVLVARGSERLNRLVAELGPTARAVAGDVTDPDTARRAVDAARTELGGVHVLVNNAGGNLGLMGPMFAVGRERASEIFDLNVIAPVEWSRAAWEGGMSEGGGVIVNVSSLSASRGSAATGYYAVSKAALDRVTSQLAWELGPRVRVVGVGPGMTSTEMTATLVDRLGPTLYEHVPAQRIATTADVASAILFLVSDAASFITGVTLPIDGGELGVPLGSHLPMPRSAKPRQPAEVTARGGGGRQKPPPG